MSRKTICTRELTLLIASYVELHNPPHVAAQRCGISVQTHYNWMNRGMAGSGRDDIADSEKIFVEYFEAVKAAQAEAQGKIFEALAEMATEGYEVVKTRTKVLGEGEGATVLEKTTEKITKRHWQALAWVGQHAHKMTPRPDLDEALPVVARAIVSGDEDAARALRDEIEKATKSSKSKG